MKQILFDLLSAQPHGDSKFHGGGEYIKTVLERLLRKYGNRCNLTVFLDRERFLDDWLLTLLDEREIRQIDAKTESDVAGILQQDSYDVLYTGIPYAYCRSWVPEGTVTRGTIHGLRSIELPGDAYAYKYMQGKDALEQRARYRLMASGSGMLAEKARQNFYGGIEFLDEIVCVSEHTKYSLMHFYPQVCQRPLPVFYTPAKHLEEETLPKVRIKEPFLLLIGGNRWVKNAYRALVAIDRLLEQNYLAGCKIIVVGAAPVGIRRELRHRERYVFLDYVEPQQLEALYHGCDTFVFPSLNEGFGMPPLEAMRYGKTCVVSGVCSLPEICGDAVYYVNPYDLGELKNRILHACREKIDPGKVRARFDTVHTRQMEDLNRVCEFVVG